MWWTIFTIVFMIVGLLAYEELVRNVTRRVLKELEAPKDLVAGACSVAARLRPGEGSTPSSPRGEATEDSPRS
jgi:hypothetical protein